MNQAQQAPYTKQNLIDLSKIHKVIIWMILLIIGLSIFLAFKSSDENSNILDKILRYKFLIQIAVISWPVSILGVYFFYKFAIALRLSNTWIYSILAFIPFIDLLMLLFFIGIGFKRLKANEVEVGIFGAKMENFGNTADSPLILKIILSYPIISIVGIILLITLFSSFSSNESIDEFGNVCVGNCENGQGTKIWTDGRWTDGRKYIGQWKNGNPDGQGTMIIPVNGKVNQKYSRDVAQPDETSKNNSLEDSIKAIAARELFKSFAKSQGYRFSNLEAGEEYKGEWKSGKPDGQGTYLYNDGSSYTGSFKDGYLDGNGTFVYSDGRKYIGDWVKDDIQGNGKYIMINGDKYVGEFSLNKIAGYGTFYWADGRKYIGEWSNSQRQGEGTMYFIDGRKYIGTWMNDEPIIGKLYLADGSLESGSKKTDWGEIADWTIRGLELISILKGH